VFNAKKLLIKVKQPFISSFGNTQKNRTIKPDLFAGILQEIPAVIISLFPSKP